MDNSTSEKDQNNRQVTFGFGWMLKSFKFFWKSLPTLNTILIGAIGLYLNHQLEQQKVQLEQVNKEFIRKTMFAEQIEKSLDTLSKGDANAKAKMYLVRLNAIAEKKQNQSGNADGLDGLEDKLTLVNLVLASGNASLKPILAQLVRRDFTEQQIDGNPILRDFFDLSLYKVEDEDNKTKKASDENSPEIFSPNDTPKKTSDSDVVQALTGVREKGGWIFLGVVNPDDERYLRNTTTNISSIAALQTTCNRSESENKSTSKSKNKEVVAEINTAVHLRKSEPRYQGEGEELKLGRITGILKEGTEIELEKSLCLTNSYGQDVYWAKIKFDNSGLPE